MHLITPRCRTFQKLVIAAVFILLFPALLVAQPHPVYRNYTTDHGLPTTEVYHVLEDSKGYVWFATDMGVSRYNGYEFETFTIKEGLPDNTVFEIYEDHKGKIWFVPMSCMLSYYENGKIHQFKYNDSLKKVLKNPLRYSFVIDKGDNIHLGVFGNHYLHISNTGILREIDMGRDSSIYAAKIIEIEPGKLLRRVQRVDPAISLMHIKTSFLNCSLKLPVPGIGIGSRNIITHKKEVLLTILRTIYIVKSCGNMTERKLDADITWLSQDSKSHIWAGAFKSGVYCFKNGDLASKPLNFLRGLSVTSVCRTREGGYWFTTLENGAFYTPSLDILTYDLASGLTHARINALATDGETIFAGLQDGNVHAINGDSIENLNTSAFHNGYNIITRLYYDKDEKRLWVSGYKATYSITNKKMELLTDFFSASSILKDAKGLTWLSNYYSIGTYKGNGSLQPLLTNQRVTSMAHVSDNRVLVGTLTGLRDLDVPSAKLIDIPANRHPSLSRRITDIELMEGGRLAIGTKGFGVMLKMNDTIYDINTNNGLASDNVNDLYRHGNHLWVATNNGLSRISITSYKPFSYSVKNFRSGDGLASSEIREVIYAGGKIWIATVKGLTSLPEAAGNDSLPPIPLYLVSVMADADSVQNGFTAEFGKAITFKYIGLSVNNNGKLLYRYRIQELDTAWTRTTSREAHFPGLREGDYTFSVQVIGKEGAWSEPVSLSFTIRPPWWRTWWFRIPLALLIAFMIALPLRYREEKIRKREEEKSRIDRQLWETQLKALRAQMNPHFAFNVMNSIQRFLLENDSDSAHRYLGRFSKLLRLVLEHSERSSITLAEEITALKLYVELEMARFRNRFEFEVKIEDSLDPEEVMIPSMLIQPHVENAICHGLMHKQGKGKLSISIKGDAYTLVCTIEDDGIGRAAAALLKDQAVKHNSMGVKITGERIRLLNTGNGGLQTRITDLTDEAGNAAGTRVELFIPLVKEAVE